MHPLLRHLALLAVAASIASLSHPATARAAGMSTFSDYRPKDFTLVKKDGTYHLFYIRHNDFVPRWADESDFGHAISTDLYHWTQLPPVLGMEPGSWDNLHVWAPHIVSWNGLWWMFYAGVTDIPGQYVETQRIGVAVSSDLMTWSRVPGQPVWSTANTSWAWWTTRQSGMSCRDPFVMPDPAAPGQWLLYYTATLATDTLSQLVGVARSPTGDPMAWQDEKPLWVTYKDFSFNTVVESPHLLEHEGRWFLFITTNAGQPITFFVSSNPIGEVGEWTPRGRLRNMLGYDTSEWYASETMRDGNVDLFAFVTIDSIELRQIVWGTGDNFSLAEPSFFHMVSMGWTTKSTPENQYVGLILKTVNRNAIHGPLVAWTLAPDGTQSPAPMSALGLPPMPVLSRDSLVVPWYVRRWPPSLPPGQPMRVRVAMEDETATTPWLTVYPNPVTQPPTVWHGGRDPSPADPDEQPGVPPSGPGDSLIARPSGIRHGPIHDPVDPSAPPEVEPDPPVQDPAAAPASPDSPTRSEARGLGLRVLEGTPLGAGPAIVFELHAPAHARVDVFDVQGRKRLTLADRGFGAGAQVLPWDGRDATGERAGRGLYFVRVTTSERTAVVRLCLGR